MSNAVPAVRAVSRHPRSRLLSTLALCALTTWMSACGGGGGGSSEPSATAATPAASPATETAEATTPGLRWRGVNLSGAEYNSTSVPGRYGYEYFYPGATAVDYFQAKGMNLIRLPFLWERMQPTLYQPLDTTELQRLVTFVNGATAKGLTVLIDPHNYGRYRQQVIGSSGVPHSAFGDFWYRLSGHFKANPRVIFGLMNEPYGMTTENWVGAANDAIRRIRAAGATNTIAVPGNAWSGAYSWTANYYGTPNAQAMLQITDSRNNLVFEVHQYLDTDSSGTTTHCVSPTIGAQRLQVFTDWLRANGKRGLLGEFGAANTDTCRQALNGMLAFMESNSDVWTGWAYWQAGAWASHDPFSLQPVNGVDKPQMQVLAPYLD
jgi:endoglucanase